MSLPELQGVMGRLRTAPGDPKPGPGHSTSIISPNRAGGPIPEGMEGPSEYYADKMDTIVGCFGVGLIPTGTAGPVCPCAGNPGDHPHHPGETFPHLSLPTSWIRHCPC